MQGGCTGGDVQQGRLQAVDVELCVAAVAQQRALVVLVPPADAAPLPGRVGPAVKRL